MPHRPTPVRRLPGTRRTAWSALLLVAAALAVLEPACAAGTQEACYRFGLHLSVSSAAADRRRARAVLTASCAAGLPESCEALKALPPQ